MEYQNITDQKFFKIADGGGKSVVSLNCYFVLFLTEAYSTRLRFTLFYRKRLMLENKSIIHCIESLGCWNIRTDRRRRGVTGMACKIFWWRQTGPV